MTSLKQIKKMREIIRGIETGSFKFSTAYSYLDQLERNIRGEDEDQSRLDQYVKPIQKIMQNNRNSLEKLKENGENFMNLLKQSSHRKTSQKTYSNEELDSEIYRLTSILKSKKMIR